MYQIKVYHIKHNTEHFVQLQYKELKISEPNEVTQKMCILNWTSHIYIYTESFFFFCGI
jgi:hypothetical protein